MNNIQTFSQSSDQYAKHRPQYPEELFAYLDELCQSHESAWDCATGNGQAAVSCAKYFSQVQATDISSEQLQHRILHPKVQYSMCPAETTPFANLSFDLIMVATAVHWFNQEQFHREVGRVLKPSGVLAVWTYGLLELEPEINAVIARELLEPIDPLWASGNRQVMNGYRDLALPFEAIRNVPAFAIKVEWTLEQLSAYLRTWSAVKRFAVERGADPVERLESALKPIWGEPDTIRVVQMPLFVKASRKPA